MTREACPPVIIIGMHRSGTSMITRMLGEMGLFIGKGKESGENQEHPFFVKINEWLFCQSGGSWKDPEPVHNLLDNHDLLDLVADYLAFYLKTSRAISFLGWRGYLRYSTPARLDFPWGWKDPRNTYTLPVWLKVFSNAKIVHIHRHGVDVANSIKVRAEIGIRNSMDQLPFRSKTKYRSLYHRWFEPRLWGFETALQDGSLKFGFALWEKYLQEAQSHVESHKDRAIVLRYEDFLIDPQPAMKSLAEFCDLPVTDSVIAKLAGRVKKERAYAYRKHGHLVAFAEEQAERLKKWGY